MARLPASAGVAKPGRARPFEIARRALGGPGDEGRASYQIAVSRCDRCAAASTDAGGESHPVDEATASLFECDAQCVGTVDDEQEREPVAGEQRSRPVRGGQSRAPVSPRTGAAPAPTPRRATQTIPPATRRKVIRRHKGRCAVPGCRHHLFLDVHHVHPRAEGGDHDPDRLVILCGSHHRAVHAGRLVVEGSASEGFVSHHPDGTPYGGRLNPEALEAVKKVERVLVHQGFEKSQARNLVQEAQRRGAPSDVAGLFRAAIQAC